MYVNCLCIPDKANKIAGDCDHQNHQETFLLHPNTGRANIFIIMHVHVQYPWQGKQGDIIYICVRKTLNLCQFHMCFVDSWSS